MGLNGNGSWLSYLITSIANFGTQYNFGSISIALLMMSQSECTSSVENCQDGVQANWVVGSSSALVFVGCVIGQLTMGYLGDYFSRNKALAATLIIAMISALLSAVAPNGSAHSVYGTIITFRFFLGLGLGGIYPLSATKSSEDSATSSSTVNSSSTAKSFFWQMPGILGPWLVGYFCTYSNLSTSIRWRVVLGIGAVPLFIAILGLLVEGDPQGKQPQQIEKHDGSNSKQNKKEDLTMSGILQHLGNKVIQRKLMATGAPWFVYDVIVYGIGLIGGYIVANIHDSHTENISSDKSIRKIAGRQMIAICLCIPATLFGIYLLPKVGLRNLQIYSFLFLTFCFVIFASLFNYLKDNDSDGLFAVYCICSMSMNLGIGITSFTLPSALFDKEIRSTFNGICSALGKLGAVIGAYSFIYIALDFSYPAVLAVCSVLGLLGAFLSYWYIRIEDLQDEISVGKRPEHSDSSARNPLTEQFHTTL